MSAKVFVVVLELAGGERRFWSGRRWVSEYPDCMEYRTAKAARAARFTSGAGDDAVIMADYGLNTEREVAP